MLKAQHSSGGAALAVTMFIALSHVAGHSRQAAAVQPEQRDVPADSATSPVRTFQNYDIEEVFSDSDGSVQFVELQETAGEDGHFQFAGNQLTSGTNIFTFPTDLPDPATANRSVLIATAAFAALPGAVTPDYIIPEHFFEVTGDTISLIEIPTHVLVDTFIFGGSVQDPCPCNGDVDGSGLVQVLDIAFVFNCLNGVEPPPPQSCDDADVNCDGTVDACDASRIYCQFIGLSDCCANTVCGACCNSGAGFDPCLVISEDFCYSPLIDEGDYIGDGTVCDPWPCDRTMGDGTNDVFEWSCPGGNLACLQGLSDAAVSWPISPVGACCNVGNGQCQDGIADVDCNGIELVWTASTACSELSCVGTPLPTDGTLSLNSDGTTAVNSPTNFAGEMGSVNAAPAIPAVSGKSLVVLMLLFVAAAAVIMRTRRHDIPPST